MGDSSGRSAQNRTGKGAIRRNTERERQDIDPPTLKPMPTGWIVPENRLSARLRGAAWVALVVALAVLVLGSVAFLVTAVG